MARPDIFTTKEKSWLINNYETASWEEILSAIKGKTKVQIISKASKMELKRDGVCAAKFNKKDDEIIKKYYRTMKVKDLISIYFPNRSAQAITQRANLLGIKRYGDWTRVEDEIIITNYYEMPMKMLCELLPNKAKSAIHCRIKQLGLSGASMYKYSQDDILFVKNNYQILTDEELGDILHRNAQCIKELRRKHKFYRKDLSAKTNYASFDMYVHRHNNQWKRDSAKQSSYKCFLTGDTFDEIHHLKSRNVLVQNALQKLKWNKQIDINECSDEDKNIFLTAFLEEQAKYPLGICLSKKIHKLFHKEFGYGYNTPEQFVSFVKKFFPEKLDKLLNII